MAGFMAGFGNAVARGIEAGQQRRFESEEREKQRQYDEKQDAFRMYYNTFNDNQKAMREAERQDRERVRQSETIAQVTGFDPRATYELLASDYTPAQIMQMKDDGYEIEDIVDAQQGKQESPANEQTKQMMGEQSSDEFSKKLAANTGIPENRVRETMSFDPSASNDKKARSLDIRWKIGGGKKSNEPTSVPELARAIIQARRSGDTEAEQVYTEQLKFLQEAEAGGKPERMLDSENELVAALNDPNLSPEMRQRYETQLSQLSSRDDEKRARDIRTNLELRGDIPPEGLGMMVVKTPEGVKVMPADQVPEGVEARPQSPAEQKLIEEIEDKYKEQALKVQDKINNYNQAKEIVRDINELVDVDRDIGTWGATLSATTSDLVKNAAGLLNSTGMIVDAVEKGETDVYEGAKTLEEAANTIRDLIPRGSAAERQSLNQALMEVNKRRLAYMTAALEGQSGIGLSQKEYDKFYNLIGTTSDKIKQSVNTWLKTTQRGLSKEVSAINDNPKNKRLKSYGYSHDLVDFEDNPSDSQSNPAQPAKDIVRMPTGSQKEQDDWYDKLPSGTQFLGPDGAIYTKE